MDYRELEVPGAWVVTPRLHGDQRGVFLEFFKDMPFAQAAGHRLVLSQGNCSVSAAGAIRGVHFAEVPPGQGKYVTCVAGAVWDVVVDLRVGAPTFGTWDAVLLDDVHRRAVYVSEGLGHGFCSLADGSTVIYLCSTPYAPEREHEVHPLDPDLAIAWPTTARDGTPLTWLLSAKDEAAPSLAAARTRGLLPTAVQVDAYLAEIAAR